MKRVLALVACFGLFLIPGSSEPAAPADKKVFRAGAVALDITPTKFPVIVSGMFDERTAKSATDALHARCLVLDDGTTRVALLIVDSLMLPRELLNHVKKLAQATTGIPAERILISATHTHSAPSVMGALGSRADAEYSAYLVPQLVRAIEQAHKNLQPAQIGWGVVPAPEHTHNRRWIRRPDRLLADPFGDNTVRANMHPGYQSPDVIGPSGPVDPDLSLLSVRTPGGKPLALLANYSMHYFGSTPVSADYFGRFAEHVKKLLGASDPAFVGILSQGTSGDLMWMNYGQPRQGTSLDDYAAAVAKVTHAGYRQLKYHDWVPLAMAETKLTLKRRVPDEKRLAWAKEQVSKIEGPLPKGRPQIYAKEQLYLHEEPTRELKLQALRIGDLGITALPNEVFALTGLKLKAFSPLPTTFNISLANGAEGYIPPPEQHKLGGYTTWPARTAGLEETAEPKIVEALLGLLEQVAGQPRRTPDDPPGPYVQAVLAARPLAYWRLADMAGPSALPGMGKVAATYEDGIALYLEGPPLPQFAGKQTINRAAHFAGGRLKAELKNLGDTYSVEMWCWNGLPTDARPITGTLFARGQDGDPAGRGDLLALGAAKLVFATGTKATTSLTGKTDVSLKTWHHVVLVREGKRVAVYLNGQLELAGEAEPAVSDALFFGGRTDKQFGWEGKLDEIAVFNRALRADEAAAHFQAFGQPVVQANDDVPPTPEEMQKLLRLPPGLRIELVAAEPDVQSPVALAFDEDGRMFVVEMLDYPNGPAKGQPPEGRIRLLEDRDGSGRYRATGIYAEQLLFANGVLPWKGGVLVTSAPNILYLRDTKGTGKADQRDLLYEGFAVQNPQLRVSHPNLGIDNWIYVANGLRSAQAKRTGRADAKPIDLSGRDFRFDLLGDRAEGITGMGQFGNTFDDWGERFVCTNRNHWVHMVLPEHYVRRNPFLAASTAHRDNQGPGGATRIFPLARQETTAAEHAGTFTAACGVFVYRGDLLPEAYRGAVFTCEPTGSLVHQEVLIPKGATFTGRPAQVGSEFLASPHSWFRPVFVTSGPDGALYVIDLCRKVVEHPEFMPPALKNRPDLLLGKERGRIWRIVPDKHQSQPMRPQLSKATTAQLVALLESQNAWQRTTAQRLLLERQDAQAEEPLRRLVETSKQPLARVQAAWLLQQRDKLTRADVLPLLKHDHMRVREHGARLSERWLGQDTALQTGVLALADDADAHVRYQAALSLGAWDNARILPALAKIALAGVDDVWTRQAVASAVPQRAGVLLALLLRPETGLTKQLTADRLTLVQELAALVGGRQDAQEIADVLEALVTLAGTDPGSWQMAGRKGLAEGLQRRGVAPAAFLNKLPPERRPLLAKMDALMDRSLALARDGQGATPERLEAVRLLAHVDWKTAGPVLSRLIGEEPAPAVRVAAVRSAAAFPNPEVAALVVKSWSSYPPAVQREAIESLLAQPERTVVLLKEIDAGRIKAADLDPLRRLQLLNHRRSDIRDKAKSLLGQLVTPERKKVVDEFRSALSLQGDARRGREIFQKATCISCHRLGNLGHTVGSDIADLRTKTPDMLLMDILDPNAAIDANFINYVVTLKDGKVLTGLLAGETASSITLRRGDNQTDVVLRQDLEPDGILSTGKSLMPEGLEKDLKPQDFADLLAFVRGWRSLEEKKPAP